MIASTIVITTPMTEAEARSTLARAHKSAHDAWVALAELHDRKGWKALGYSSFRACIAEEFDHTRQHAYALVDAGRVVRALRDVSDNLTPKIGAVAAAKIAKRLPEAVARIESGETVDAVVADLTSRPPSNRPGVASDAAPGSEEESTSTPPLPGPEAGDESVSGLEEVEPRIVITWPGGTFDVDAPSPHITAAMWREVAAFCAERARLCELNLEPTPEPQRPNNLPTYQQFDLISAVLRAEKERVWTVAELRKQTGLPTATIRNALVWLEENEYDVEKRGKGFVVKGDAA